MSLGLVCHAARLPELGAGERDAFLLFDVNGRWTGPAYGPGTEARAPLCLAIAIDASSSMRGGRFALALQATRNVLASLGAQDRVAVITFDRDARVAVPPAPFDAAGAETARRALDRLTASSRLPLLGLQRLWALRMLVGLRRLPPLDTGTM